MSSIEKPSKPSTSVRKKTPAPIVVEPSEDARTRILEATHLLVGEKGFGETSIRDIAKRSGANPALVYYYFGSKEGLFAALANANADRAGVVLREAASLQGSARERVRHFMLTWMKVVSQKARPFAPWFRKAIQAQDEHGRLLRARVSGNIGILAAILDDGIASGELRSTGLPTMTVASGMMISVAGLAMEILLTHENTKLDFSTEESRVAFVETMLSAWFSGLEVPGR